MQACVLMRPLCIFNQMHRHQFSDSQRFAGVMQIYSLYIWIRLLWNRFSIKYGQFTIIQLLVLPCFADTHHLAKNDWRHILHCHSPLFPNSVWEHTYFVHSILNDTFFLFTVFSVPLWQKSYHSDWSRHFLRFDFLNNCSYCERFSYNINIMWQ